jgi:hypothetical protein
LSSPIRKLLTLLVALDGASQEQANNFFYLPNIIASNLDSFGSVGKPLSGSLLPLTEASIGLKECSLPRRGLSGFINGLTATALADTGAGQNIVSLSCAAGQNLKISPLSESFKLGNSQEIKSIGRFQYISIGQLYETNFFLTGTVVIKWSFAMEPSEIYELVCHVLAKCTYEVILGRVFLSTTQTLSTYRNRLTRCIPSLTTQRNFRVGLCGDTCQRLIGVIGDKNTVYAVPDTGAEANLIDEW